MNNPSSKCFLYTFNDVVSHIGIQYMVNKFNLICPITDVLLKNNRNKIHIHIYKLKLHTRFRKIENKMFYENREISN